VKNALVLTALGELCNRAIALEVLDANGITEDGLIADMQAMLTFLYTRARQTNAAGEVTFQASVNTIATAIGKARDSKAIALRVEPYLIEKGYVQVGHGGRRLTDLGIVRAEQLLMRDERRAA
jgi:Holliday junction resolvasome RuvABC ATP-dependent DNA helicase subunit